MSYNFDDEDFPFDKNEISKIFKMLQQNIMKALQDQGFDLNNLDLSNLQNLSNFDLSSIPGLGNFMEMSPEELQDMFQNNPHMKRMGFSISFGPDGQPNIQPLDDTPSVFNQQRSNKSGFEEPFTDEFYSDATKSYQIIAEVQGVEHRDNVHLRVKDNELLIHAETGPFKYRKTMALQHPIDEKSLEFSLNNGVLEISAMAK